MSNDTHAASSKTSAKVARILVIDDEENIRATLAEFLTLTGYQVATAADGREGLDRLGADSFDLVLSDLKMPGVDGIAVIEWVKETQPELPVIVMTGFATVDTTIRALRLGAEDYLLKPFSLDEIERTVENSLEKRRLRERNTELTAANERLREIERIKDDLLATVSHEFRTPLTAMKGFLSLMRLTDHSNLRPDQLHALQALNDNAERLDLMICNLLTLVEAHDGAYRPILEPARIGPFLTEVVETLRETRDVSPIELDVPADVADAEALLDRIRFPLAIANLLDNALKFFRAPGETEVILRVRLDAKHVVIEVHDNGIGIAESLGDRVFDRFTQGDMSATREFQGVGLGLAVVQVVVAAHNGKVRLVTPVLGGASVRITLPRMEAH